MAGKLDDIIVYSMPRTGSTVAWQIVRELVGTKPGKSHGLIPLDVENPVIVTIRNPIYSIMSEVRVGANMSDSVRDGLAWSERYLEVHNMQNILILKYEDYINYPQKRIMDIASFLCVSISDNMINKILDNTSISINKETSDALEIFDKWDPVSYIHGSHIDNPNNEGEIIIPDEYIDDIKIISSRFGY